MFFIEYKLDKAGWAFGRIGNSKKEIKFVASYLHNSLLELAQSAIDIKKMTSKRVVFMDEPGEYILVIKRIDNIRILYELRWYNDWFSWGMYPEDKFVLELSGETTVPKYINQVRNVLFQLMEKHTEKEYKELWIEHPFPMKEFNELR
ncbi:hypothetical protein Q4Q39_06845 [Flavivirga amylovorans]|uniref:Uncharacterized protein n=1 Tax=Flavivirga amylovorans TaxID=870486 RepID=A0ABT8WZL4_9FLAO|nr:hypothetical protein [Flavivirga amylovorans]MDO5987123.1 hypothetical protein [Flavivirga amylovorans]